MKNLTLTLEEEISLISKYSITPNELMMIRSLLILQDNENEELFKDYVEAMYPCGVKLRDMLLSLQEKGIILKTGFKIPNEGEKFDPYAIPINKAFLKNLYRSSFEMGKELFNVYPQWGIIQGCTVPLRTIARKFDSLEDAYFRYGRSIRWNPDKHKQIVELVKWAKENNILNCSFASFIVNNGWIDLESLKDGDTNNIRTDMIKML